MPARTMDPAQNTQDSDLRTTMFMVNAPMMITGGNFAISTSTPAPNNQRQVLAELFERHISLSATHDTIEDHHPPRCDPDSHQAFLERLISWAEEPESPSILWVFGPKGAGKTSIAGTLAEILQRRDRLGATFFLNEDDKRASEMFLIPTVALQLSESIPALQPLMIDVMQRVPFLFRKSLSTQIERLIVRPILSLEPYDYFQQVIIIDGLDEYHAPGSASRILRVIHDSAPRLLGRLRFLILSRPEAGTRLKSSTHRIAFKMSPQSEQAQVPYCTDDNDKRRAQSKGAREVKPTASDSTSSSPTQSRPLLPPSASVMYIPPLAPIHRASVQQPTYVNQPNAANPVQTFYMPIIPPQEEPCVECAMRDHDMADVDVISPGAWERESDAEFEEHKARELEGEANGIVVDNPTKPRIKGGRLTEQNVELWLSNNSREPGLRQQILNAYIKSQRALLEAESVAHARAMQETRVRESHSQLGRSARDLGSSCSSSPINYIGGEPSLSPNSPHDLGNGIAEERFDVRNEENEARDREQVNEMREPRFSQGSLVDVAPIISGQSINGPLAENDLRVCSEYSSPAQPTSVDTAPIDRPDLPHAYSTTLSSSDAHSMKSSCSRRKRFVVACQEAWWTCSTRVLTAGILLRGPYFVSTYLTGRFLLEPPLDGLEV